ncbi:MAG: HD domain-containing protein [Planctomycetaceae bacterium]
MPNPFLPDVVESAIRFAARAHRTQLRKGCDLPYLVHPAAVATILERAGFGDEILLAAAWLHDVVEDTDATLEALAAEFPAEVVEIVDGMSEKKRDAEGKLLSWAHRKAHHIGLMQTASLETKTVMLADKLHNMISMSVDASREPNIWDRFTSTREALLQYYRDMVATTNSVEPLTSLREECERVLDSLAALD